MMKVFALVILSLTTSTAIQAQTNESTNCDPVILFLGDRTPPTYAHLSYYTLNKSGHWVAEFPNTGIKQEDWTSRVKVEELSETLVDSGQYKQITGLGTFINKYKVYTKKVLLAAEESIGVPRHIQSDVVGMSKKLLIYLTCEKTVSIPVDN